MTKKLSMNKGTAGALLCAAGGMSGSMGQYLFTRQGIDFLMVTCVREHIKP